MGRRPAPYCVRSRGGCMPDLPHVVVLGAGITGVAALKELENVQAQVTLVDRNRFHTFLPLIYEVASRQLEADHICTPIEKLRRPQKFDFVQGEVAAIDPDHRSVSLTDHQ